MPQPNPMRGTAARQLALLVTAKAVIIVVVIAIILIVRALSG